MTDGSRRSYPDGCAIAHALNLVGERWALLVVRELLLGPKRFADLQAGLPGVGPTILSQRLRELEGAGILRRRTLPQPSVAKVYELTEWGKGLRKIVTALGRWGSESPVIRSAGDVGSDSLLLSLEAFFQRRPSAQWSATYEIWLDGNPFAVEVVDGELISVTRGSASTSPDARLETDTTTFGELLNGTRQLPDARAEGLATASGRLRTLHQLFRSVRGSSR